jgi:signal transduction histidine kinase
MAPPRFARPAEGRVIAGVCAGIAQALAVDVTLVRLVFALLALAGGAGILLYLALWSYGSSTRPWWALLVLAAGVLLLHAFGLSDRAVGGIALVATGLALVWHRRGTLRPDSPRAYAGLALAGLGVVLLLQGEGGTTTLLPPGAVAGALLLVAGPWLWRLAVERDAERTARIRTEERAEVAARVHDSVLQTLALIQRHATEPRRVASLARRQERELRAWLYGGEELDAPDTFAAALRHATEDVETRYDVEVELVQPSDAPLDEDLDALVSAAREALTNAAKHAGTSTVSVLARVSDREASVFVRDRGRGFDRTRVPRDRAGVRESIEGRMARHGGRAQIHTALGEGTEVELILPRGDRP